LSFLTAVGKLFPEVIHFFLRFTVHDKGNRLGEFEMRSAVQGRERLSVKFE
jgi:hypothetical protein